MVPNIFALDRGCEKTQEHCDLLVSNWCLVRIMGIIFFSFVKN